MRVDAADRWGLGLLGVAATALGAAALLRAFGVLGDETTAVVDAEVDDWLARNADWTWAAGLAIAVLLGLLGVWWLATQVAPTRPGDGELVLHRSSVGTLQLDAHVAAAALEADLAGVPGVAAARARVHHERGAPVVSMVLECSHRASVDDVRSRVEHDVLPRFEEFLGRDDVRAEATLRFRGDGHGVE